MMLGWINRADDAVLSPGSEIGSLPAANIKHVHLSKKWHTVAGVKSSYVVLDLGAQYPVDLLAVLGTNLTPTATFRLRGSNSDPTGVTGEIYDSTTIGAGVLTDYPAVYHKLPSQQSARYWRLDITDNSVASNLQIGRVFLGPGWTCSREYGWGIAWQDATRVARARGGQRWTDAGPRARMLQFSVNYLSVVDMMTNPFELARRNGLTKDVLAYIDDGESGANYIPQRSVFGAALLVGEPIVQEKPRCFRARYQIEEAL